MKLGGLGMKLGISGMCDWDPRSETRKTGNENRKCD